MIPKGTHHAHSDSPKADLGRAGSLRSGPSRDPQRKLAGARAPAGSSRERSSHSRSPRVPFALLVTGLILGGLVLLLVLNTFSAANELRRHDLASQDASVAAQVEELQIEVADSAAPAKLAAAALALGMVPAGNPAFLVLGKDGSVRVLGSAAPASPAVVDLPTPPAAPKSSAGTAKGGQKHKKTDGKHRGGAGHGKPGSKAKKQNKNKKAAGHGAKKQHGKSGAKNTEKTDQPPAPPSPTPTPTVTLPGGDR